MTNVFQLKNKPHGKDRMKLFLEEGFVCIGWPGIGDLSNADRNEIRHRLESAYDDYEGQRLGAYTGAVNAFVNTMKAGDVVLVPEGVIVHIGILDDYYYDSAYDNAEGMCHRRKVTWTATVPKSRLNPQVLEFVRNRGILTKFPGSFEETDLEDLLTITEYGEVKKSYVLTEPPIQKAENLFDVETVQRARTVLEDALNSDDPEKQIQAAGEILRLSK